MNSQNLFVITLCSLLSLFIGCSKKQEEQAAPQPIRLRIVNVLDEKLFADAHIKGAPGVESVCVPFISDTLLREQSKTWDKTIPVVTYCSNYWCTASDSAAKLLHELGFKEVYVYKGGIAEWYQLSKRFANDFAIDGPAQESYLTMETKALPVPHEVGQPQIVTAEELQKMIKNASMLSGKVQTR